jgi:hypothetical protein
VNFLKRERLQKKFLGYSPQRGQSDGTKRGAGVGLLRYLHFFLKTAVKFERFLRKDRPEDRF